MLKPVSWYDFILIDMFMIMFFVFLDIIIWVRFNLFIVKIVLIIFLAFAATTAGAMHVLLNLVIIF